MVHDRSDDNQVGSPDAATVGDFSAQVALSLEATEQDIKDLAHSRQSFESDASLVRAREIVNAFRPVPQIIWRLCNYTLGRPGHINTLTTGHAFGLKKLFMHVGADPIMGLGRSNLNTSDVVYGVASDVIAAVAMMYAVSRRLQSMPFQKLWAPMLDEALLRANLGFCAGQMSERFGIGRSMLAGFAGRIGMVVLIATGDQNQAHEAVSALVTRADPQEIGRKVYGADPAHVAAMVLSASGCGRDAILGLGAFGLSKRAQAALDPFSALWLASTIIIENVLNSNAFLIEEGVWLTLGFDEPAEREELSAIAKTLKRSGHSWHWLARPDSE